MILLIKSRQEKKKASNLLQLVFHPTLYGLDKANIVWYSSISSIVAFTPN